MQHSPLYVVQLANVNKDVPGIVPHDDIFDHQPPEFQCETCFSVFCQNYGTRLLYKFMGNEGGTTKRKLRTSCSHTVFKHFPAWFPFLWFRLTLHMHVQLLPRTLTHLYDTALQFITYLLKPNQTLLCLFFQGLHTLCHPQKTSPSTFPRMHSLPARPRPILAT